MPTYDYRCKSCDHEFEEFQSMSADPLVMCPKCANPSLKRLMSSGVGLVFKGSGFYLTDYKTSGSSSSPNNSKTDLKPTPKAETKSESKSESKSTTETTVSTEKK